ncbi:extracellular solute-binding protein [Salinibacterium sp. UTAS2018]|uniref:extracellular solute-binding protein n=1 Tax=Salinibacterium sp. UTAS2018 TaxID=2508880 RepID=UPI001009534F|nr:extracellular solute-binding protein [Salinibacterium sp. UTAS2018]QAV70604.1 extracellular solute-binding protein [Salinibacterium sp. UTAS2018]
MSPTVIRGMTWEHERGYGSVVKAAEAYRSVAPDVEVQWEYRSLQAFADQDLESLVEQYDLLVIDHPHIPVAAEDNLFTPLNGRGFDIELATLATQSVGRSHESYQHLGQQWGLALDAAAQVAAYRPDLLEAPPRTWPEVIALAEEGRVLWPFKPVDAYSSLITIAAGLGEDPMATPGVFLSEDVLTRSMELLTRLARLVPADNAGFNPIQVADVLAESDTFAYSPLLFGYTNYSRAGYRLNRVQYIDIPSSTRGLAGSLLGGAGIAVSSRSQVMDAAIAHAFWLASGDVQESSYYDGGGQPGNAVAWESARTNADSLDFFTGTRATLEGAYMRPRFATYIELQNAVSPLVTSALLGEITIAELRERLDAGVAEWLVR